LLFSRGEVNAKAPSLLGLISGQRIAASDSDPRLQSNHLYSQGFEWAQVKTFNEFFNGFSTRSLSGTGTSRTRPLHGCERGSVHILTK
jgi:hypothetical protein